MAGNISHIGMFGANFEKVATDYHFNTFNSYSMNQIQSMSSENVNIDTITLSVELHERQIRRILHEESFDENSVTKSIAKVNSEMVVYGKIPYD
jgi:hypothetical protein